MTGYKLSDLTAAASSLDALLTTPSQPTQTNILSVEIGANDLGNNISFGGNPNGFTTALATYLDARRAAGWKVVIHTILSRSDGTNSTLFNPDRATANTTIRTWLGTHADAIADVAADATIGPDGVSDNLTYYNADKVHPIDAAYAIWEPITRAAVNSL